MVFPVLFVAFGVLVAFFPSKVERLLIQKIVLGFVFVVLLLTFSIFGEAYRIGWSADRVFLLLASLWFIFCGILLALPILKLQRWIAQGIVFQLRSNLKIFALVLLLLSVLAFIVAL